MPNLGKVRFKHCKNARPLPLSLIPLVIRDSDILSEKSVLKARRFRTFSTCVRVARIRYTYYKIYYNILIILQELVWQRNLEIDKFTNSLYNYKLYDYKI